LRGYTQFGVKIGDRVTLAIYRGGVLRSRKEGSEVTEKQDVGYAEKYASEIDELGPYSRRRV